jgi:hypothetical protein
MHAGQFVNLRGRRWLIEAVQTENGAFNTVSLSCISDDAQGEPLEVLWDAEIAAETLDDDSWSPTGRRAPDDPEVLAAHLRTVRWNSATAAERDLFQAPFRATGSSSTAEPPRPRSRSAAARSSLRTPGKTN